MIIRPSGGSSGIREYLETGKKAGRDFDRDQLDRRVKLAGGSLEETDRIIQSMDTDGQRYLHLTLSFKEDELSDETLKAITEEVRSLLFSAYKEDEYNFYAEAHQPIIRSYPDHNNKPVIRKGHIHIVVPQVNLLTGQRLEPFGKVENNLKYIDAIQEHINNKFGLLSPKDNPRIGHMAFTDASDILERYGADIFEKSNKDVRQAILDTVLDQRIESWEGFQAFLEGQGLAVRERHARNTGLEYLHIKPVGPTLPGKSTGINLTDGVFSKRFIEKTTEEKRSILSVEIVEKFETATTARRDPDYITATIAEWQELKSREIKLINSGNRKLYQEYKAADQAGKLAILDRRESFYEAKHRKELHHARENSSRPHELGSEPPPSRRDRLRTLSELDVVQLADRGQVLLPDHVPGELEHQGTESDHALRRDLDRAGGNGLTLTGSDGHHQARETDSVTGELLGRLKESQQQRKAAANPEFAEIKAKLDASRLLTHLAKSHGLREAKYAVVKGKDGSDRIQCGTVAYNVSDFLTKHMNMSFWDKAAPILRETYQAQLANEPQAAPSPAPKSGLWRDFQDWRKSDWKQEKDEAWRTLKTDHKSQRDEIKQVFAQEKAKVYGDKDRTTAAQRRTAMSLNRMNRVQSEKALSERYKTETASLKEKYGNKTGDLYHEFLTRRAQKGDAVALAELRRQQRQVAPVDAKHSIEARQGDMVPYEEKAPIEEGLRYSVGKWGDVTYYDHRGEAILRDESKRVAVLKGHDRQAIETSLRLAMQKFGPQLNVNGDDDFKRRAVEVAVESGLRVEFADEKLDAYRKHLEAQKANKPKFEGLAKGAPSKEAIAHDVPDQSTGKAGPEQPNADPYSDLKDFVDRVHQKTEDAKKDQPEPRPRRSDEDYEPS